MACIKHLRCIYTLFCVNVDRKATFRRGEYFYFFPRFWGGLEMGIFTSWRLFIRLGFLETENDKDQIIYISTDMRES